MFGYLFRNGPIYTMAGGGDGRVDGALLTREERIVFVGPEADLPRGAADAEVVDLGGRPLLPGFCDAHLHFVLAALQHADLDLRDVAPLAKVQGLVAERASASEPGCWILGHGWERRLLGDGLSAALLDEVAPRHRVLLTSKDLHSAWLSTRALTELRELDRLPSRLVVQEHAGKPTGLVFEDVLSLRELLPPPAGVEQKIDSIGPFVEHLWSRGITAVHTNESVRDLELIAQLLEGTRPSVRVLANLVCNEPEELRAQAQLFGLSVPRWLGVGGVKLFLDGSFGSLTAALGQPYKNSEGRGILNMSDDELMAWLRAICDVGSYAVCHAIGDRALQQALTSIGKLGWPLQTRHRIEHAQLLSDEIMRRDDLLRYVFSGQPSHMWGDREIVAHHVPDDLGQKWAYAYRSMLDRGATLLFGSDAPVESVDPWRGIEAAITRLEDGERPPWIGTEALSLTEALLAHTACPTLFQDRFFRTGILAPGRLADLVVLNRDPWQLCQERPQELSRTMAVEQTYQNGKLVYE